MARSRLGLAFVAFVASSIVFVSGNDGSICTRLGQLKRNLRFTLGSHTTDFSGTTGTHRLDCVDPYFLDGPSEVTCTKGKWVPDLPECKTCNAQLGRVLQNTAQRGKDCVCKVTTDSCISSTGKVCGTDAKTYDSECYMKAAICEEGRLIEKAHDGPCEYGGVCTLPKPSGTCPAFEKRWYYNLQRTRCEQFDFGQCFTGRNVFTTRHECNRRCECDAWCLNPVKVGPCKHNETTERFYYEKAIETCKTMRYSGCGGNENNFASFKDCSTVCLNQKNAPEPDANCSTRHTTTLDQACGRRTRTSDDNNFLVTISVDHDEATINGYLGYLVMVWKKFYGPDRVYESNQEFIVNESTTCPCRALLKGGEYLISGVVKYFGKTQRLSINDDSFVKPYTNFQKLQACVNNVANCQ